MGQITVATSYEPLSSINNNYADLF